MLCEPILPAPLPPNIKCIGRQCEAHLPDVFSLHSIIGSQQSVVLGPVSRILATCRNRFMGKLSKVAKLCLFLAQTISHLVWKVCSGGQVVDSLTPDQCSNNQGNLKWCQGNWEPHLYYKLYFPCPVTHILSVVCSLRSAVCSL